MAAGGQINKQLNLASCVATPDPFKLTPGPLNLFTFGPCIKSCMLKVYTLEQFAKKYISDLAQGLSPLPRIRLYSVTVKATHMQ